MERVWHTFRQFARTTVQVALVLSLLLNLFPASMAKAVNSVPKILNYQARLTDSGGVQVPNGALSVIFKLYDGSGTCLYSAQGSCGAPSAKSVTVTGGVFTTQIGSAAEGDNEIPDSLFDNNVVLLGITIGADAEMTPRKRLTATAYALNADRLDDLDVTSSGSTTAYIPSTTANGNLVITGDPQGTGISNGSVYINPATASGNETLFSIADNGSSRFQIDKEGDITTTGSLLATSASTTSQFVFRGFASQSTNIFEVQSSITDRLLSVSATATTIGAGARFIVGTTSTLIINSSGNFESINNVATRFPSSQGALGSLLRNDGSGNLTWVTGSSLVNLNQAYLNASGTSELYVNSTQGAFSIADQFTGGINKGLGIGNLFEILDRTNATGDYSARFFTISSTSTLINPLNNVIDYKFSIGNAAPANMFTVGSATSTFEVNTSGNLVKVNNIPYSWPTTQGGTLSVLQNTGTGALTWVSGSALVNLNQAYLNSSSTVEISLSPSVGAMTIADTFSGTGNIFEIQDRVSALGFGDYSRRYFTVSSTSTLINPLNNAQNYKFSIGNAAPANMFTIGSATSTFEVNGTGNLIKVNNVAYSWPISQGGTSTVLQNNGSGTLSWVAGSGLVNLNQAFNSSTSANEIYVNGTQQALTIADQFTGGINKGNGVGSLFEIQDRTNATGDYSARFLTISSTSTLINPLNNVQNYKFAIGNAAPASMFTIGSATSTFEVNGTGNLVKVNNVVYSWPSSQGAASTVLQNNGSGTLTWVAGSGLVNLNQAYLNATGTTEIYVNSTQGALSIQDQLTGGINKGSGIGTLFEVFDRTNATGDYSARFFTISSTSTLINPLNNVQNYKFAIGNATPANIFTVGSATSTFEVNASGNLVKINNVPYSWTASQGGANTYLRNDGSGNLSWQSVAGGSTTLGQAYLAATSTAEIYLSDIQGALTIADSYSSFGGNLFEIQDRSTIAGDYSARFFTVSSTSTIIGGTSLGYFTGIGTAIPNSALTVASDTDIPTANIFEVQNRSTTEGEYSAKYFTVSSTSVQLMNGTANMPALAFTNGASTGFYSISNQEIGLSWAGFTNLTFSRSTIDFINSNNSAIIAPTPGNVSLGTAAVNLTFGANDPTGLASFRTGLTVGGRIIASTYGESTGLRLPDYAGGFPVIPTDGVEADIVWASALDQLFVYNGAVMQGIASNVNQAYLGATGTTEVYANPTQGALSIADQLTGGVNKGVGIGNLFEIQDRTNATGDYSAQFFTISSTSTLINPLNNVQNYKFAIGNSAPASMFTIGSATSTFEVNGTGNLVKVNNVPYSWPTSQGGTSTVLQNNGSGTLSWVAGSGLVSLNQAYLNSSSTAEISLSPSIGAVTIMDTFSGTGTIFEIQDRVNSFNAGEYSRRYFTVSSTSTFINAGNTKTGYKFAIGSTTPTATLDIVGQSNVPGMNLSGFTTTGTDNLVNWSGTWNTGSSPVGFLMNITNTTSSLTSSLAQWQLSGVSVYDFRKNGTLTIASNNNGTTAGNGFEPLLLRNIDKTVNSQAIIAFDDGFAPGALISGQFLSHGTTVVGNLLFQTRDNATTTATRLTIGATNTTATNHFVMAAHANNAGLTLPTFAGAPSAVTGTAEGDVVWNSSGDHLYVYNGASFTQIDGGGSTPTIGATYLASTSTAEIYLSSAQGALTIADSFSSFGGNLFEIQDRTNATGDYSARFFTISSTSTLINPLNNVPNYKFAIGNAAPASMFTIGSATSTFEVNGTGNLVKVNNVPYSWPTSQGGASTVLMNNGSGTLTWTVATLQQAYDNDTNGSDVTITTNTTDGDIVIAGDQDFRVTSTGQSIFGNNTHTTTDVVQINGGNLTTGNALLINGGSLMSSAGAVISASGTIDTNDVDHGLFKLQANITLNSNFNGVRSSGMLLKLNDIGPAVLATTAGYHLQFTSNSFDADGHPQYGYISELMANSGSPSDQTLEALFYAVNDDTATGNQITVTSGFLADVVGNVTGMTNGFSVNPTSGTITNGFAVGTSGTVTNGINFTGATAMTTDFIMQNGEVMHNNTDGTISFTDGTNTLCSIIDVGTTGNFNCTGKVGVGTSTPRTQLDVIGAATSTPVGTASLNAQATSVWVQGDYAYVAVDGSGSNDSIEVVDIADTTAPRRVTYLNSGSDSNPNAIVVEGRYAYVVNRTGNTFQIYDVQNPNSPTQVSSLATGTNGVSPRRMAISGKRAYVTSGSSTAMMVIDISDPTTPSILTTAGTSKSQPQDVVVSGKYAYVTTQGDASSDNVDIFDIQADRPIRVGSFATGSNSNPQAVYVQGKYMYVLNASGSTMQIVDVSNPVVPTLKGTFTSVGAGGFDVTVQGTRAYLSMSSGIVEIVDVSNPAAPYSMGTLTTGAPTPQNIFIQGRYLYVVHEGQAANSLAIFDIGGAYIQQLEVGGAKIGRAIFTNLLQGNDATFTGGLHVGQGLNLEGGLAISNATNTNLFGDLVNISLNPQSGGSATGTLLNMLHMGNGVIQRMASKNSPTTNLFEILETSGTTVGIYSRNFFTVSSTNVAMMNGNVTVSTTGTMRLGGDLFVGNGSAADNDAVFFDQGGQNMRWVNSSDRFDISNDLEVDLTGTATANGVCHSNPNLATGTGGANRLLVVCTGAPTDVAEMYPTEGVPEAGTILVATNATFTYEADQIDPLTGEGKGYKAPQTVSVLGKTSTPYAAKIIGIVSTSPAVNYGRDILKTTSNAAPIALAGRVPTKVSTENGPINVGDPITTSTAIGVGMRATKPGMIVGYAMNAWSGAGVGMIEVYVQPTWHSGMTITTDGMRSLFADDFAFKPLDVSSASGTSFSSYALSFGGSTWDSGANAAVTRNISIRNDITNKDTYQLAFKNDGGQTLASLNQTGDLALAGSLTVNGGFDYAETFPATPDLDAGDLVMVDPENTTGYGVKKSDKAYENTVLGVISTKPGFLTGKSAAGSQPVALAGRIPVKVNTEAGEIKPGDPITSSSAPGVGMKAAEAGRVVGIALQGWNGTGVGTITVFVNPSWWNGPAALAGSSAGGNLSIAQDSLLDFKNSTLSNVAAIVSTNGLWSITSDGYLLAEKVEAKEVSTQKLAIKADDAVDRVVGKAKLQAGYDAILVENPHVTENSVIVITFEGNPGSNWWIAEKHQGSFLLKLAQSAGMETPFTYWVVPVDGLLDQSQIEAPPDDPTGSGSGTPPIENDEGSTGSGSGTPETGSGSGTPETP